MADFYNYCNWYTVWDAKTGDLIASGTSAMVARRLGYKSTAAFTTHYAHTQTRKPKKPYKYIMRRELVERREAELPPPRTRGKGRRRHERLSLKKLEITLELALSGRARELTGLCSSRWP